MAASGKPLNGKTHHTCDQFSFSRGEKAGMRASACSWIEYSFDTLYRDFLRLFCGLRE